MQTGGYIQPYGQRFVEQVRDEQVSNQPPKEPDKVKDSDEDLLKQIRTDYSFALQYWSYNRDEAAKDMKYVQGDYWDQTEINARAGRPCLTPDEISQYLKQSTNNYRQNKRAIKVIPRGSGATDRDAARREAIIRGIQHASNAQAAYTTAYEAAVECGFGFFGITFKLVAGKPQLRLRRIPNQFTVLLDPEARESDFSDQNICFVTDMCRKKSFADKYPDAKKTSFTVEDERLAPDWFQGESIITAEYWKRKNKKVTQYITNGIEIIDKVDWPGSWIPIIPVLGEEFYVPDAAGQSKRVFFSMTRRMRVPQKMLGFIASQEAEEFGMAPRSPLLLWEGQEMADKEALTNLHVVPRAFVRLKMVESASGQSVADLPGGGRLPFSPNIQAYEIAKESWRRAIQAAAGITPLPTAAQRQGEKSGIALEKIQNQEAIGSFHFTDNMDRALEYGGRQLNELITVLYDKPQEVGIRKNDDSHGILMAGPAKHMQEFLQGDVPASGQELKEPELGDPNDYLVTDRGEYDATISTGPNKDSEREDQSEFVDTLIEEANGLELPPQIKMKLLSIAVKMKNLGNFSDELAKLFDPSDETTQQLMQAQQQLQQVQEEAAKMQAELVKLKIEKTGKVIEMQARKEIVTNEHFTRMAEADKDRETKIAVAEITTKAQNASERTTAYEDLVAQFHQQSHEFAQKLLDQAQERSMGAQQGAQNSQQSAQAHGQAKDLAAQNSQHAQDQAVTQAALQPAPEAASE